MIVSGNGTGTSNTILAWQDELGIEWPRVQGISTAF